MRRLGRLGRCSCAITAAAGELWSRIDHELVDRAPWVPLYNPRTVTAWARASATTSTTRSGVCCWISSGLAEPTVTA
jgi:hypothetical protein